MNPSPPGRRGRGWAFAGIVSGVVAVVLVPVLFGPLGVALGVVGYAKGSRGPGVAAVVAGLVGMVAGILLTAVLLSSFGAILPHGAVAA